MHSPETLEKALEALGALLRDRGQTYTVVAIGGAALALQGLIRRATEDIDLIGLMFDDGLETAEPLPAPLKQAILDVARVQGLQDTWMNSGPTSLLRHGPPAGFVDRCAARQWDALTVLVADRYDQIHFKLLATSGPRDKHFADLRQLQPSLAELRAAAGWARTQATGEVFERELREAVTALGGDADDV